ncbi:methyltransferase domain-containing protein [Actinoplanes sp. NPDC049596]|uniref:methyltransferase domain-containing protein n=1 Tax=unclassified Actinoplanes TaxID=2626549 RepID=UPI0034464C9C
MRFTEGQEIIRRYVRGPWTTWEQTVRVVADDDRGLLLWAPVGSRLATLVDADGRTGHDLSPDRMREPRLVAGSWQHVDVLMLMRPGVAHSVWWMFADGVFDGWYVNLEAPFTRTGDGVQTTDSVLDIVVSADRQWRWKDAAEFEGHVGDPLYFDRAGADAIRAEGERVVALIEAGAYPFDGTYTDWPTTEANRASWNSIAPRRDGIAVERLRAGEVTLEDFELELAGDVRGRRVLQLACSFGDEVLSWANRGAIATGVDISDVAIAKARARAAEAGIDADFRRGDMLVPPEDLTGLDLIYLSWGAICWVPDLTAFAKMLAGRLKPGGAVLLCDHHPAWEVLAVRGRDHLAVAGDYFGRGRPNHDQDDAKKPKGTDGETFRMFVWPVSDVVIALVGAGLTLTAFTEAPEPALYAGLGPAAANLPAYYVIKASAAETG